MLNQQLEHHILVRYPAPSTTTRRSVSPVWPLEVISEVTNQSSPQVILARLDFYSSSISHLIACV
jgi:hypothetical protein